MKVAAVALMFAVTFPALQRMVRESNTAVETRRGQAAYAKKEFAAAASAFEQAQRLKASSNGAFNVGTARLAAGEMQKGNDAISKAASDPLLRAPALYNRGTAALQAKQYDRAVADLTDSLRSDPRNADAKRNLELALREKQKQEQQRPSQSGASGGSGGQNPQPSTGDGKPKDPTQAPPTPRPSEQQRRTEALLRSVEQQEREEMRRMRSAGQEPRAVGW